MHEVSRETYNRRGMSNMQLNDGPHGAWAGACRNTNFLNGVCTYMHEVSRETYNRRGMSNMQLNDGPHGAWAGACRTSSGSI